MKKNLENTTMNEVNLTDNDLIAVNSQNHICLLREDGIYQINADLRSIIQNSERVSIEYLHKLCTECQEDTSKKFIPLKTLREVYNIMNQDYKKE